jgi:hypothetical protein
MAVLTPWTKISNPELGPDVRPARMRIALLEADFKQELFTAIHNRRVVEQQFSL